MESMRAALWLSIGTGSKTGIIQTGRTAEWKKNTNTTRLSLIGT